jgi:hypothetical protein
MVNQCYHSSTSQLSKGVHQQTRRVTWCIHHKSSCSLLLSTPVRIQYPLSWKWDTTGYIVSFGHNNLDYVIKSERIMYGTKCFWNQATLVLGQPFQAPPRSATPQVSEFPAHPD